jgi:ribonuclease BN (tRNA processing enzyme)
VQAAATVTVTFAGSGDAFGSGGRCQACIHLDGAGLAAPVLLDCGATSLTALRRCHLDPGAVAAVFLSHLHGDHFGGLPFLILDGQFSGRDRPLTVTGPVGTGQRLAQAMECLFPGSTQVTRRFRVDVVELPPGKRVTVAGVMAAGWPAEHPSGSPALALRLAIGHKIISYTGDTAWTEALPEVAAGSDLLIAEAYYRDKAVPYHLRLADLTRNAGRLASRRTVLTHMSADLLGQLDQVRPELDEAGYLTASDGLVLHV